MINNVTLTGRLVRDCELKNFDNSSLGRFCMAVDRPKYKDKEKETDFIDCTMWNCEKISPYLVKGKLIGVTGSIQVRNWEDKEGQKRKVVEVRVDNLTFFPDSKKETKSDTKQGAWEDVEVPFNEDDLPF